jgi:hypothetical protein
VTDKAYDIPPLHFTEYYGVDATVLAAHGAFDISLVSDLPLFIDPFLLFNSSKPEYQSLHQSIIKYVVFLRDKSAVGAIADGLLKNWYFFKEVKQNWLGFTVLGNQGSALGPEFAKSLNANLGKLFADDKELPTEGRHLEKVSLIREGVGRDGISDFTTNLIKDYLLAYTQRFALEHLPEGDRREFRVPRAQFNYETESWLEGTYVLPVFQGDFVLLTPTDMLTRDETWISRREMIASFWAIPEAISDQELRSQVDNYFRNQLARVPAGKTPTQKERAAAAQATIDEFPELLEYYIALKEIDQANATSVSSERVDQTRRIFVTRLRALVEDMAAKSLISDAPPASFAEALQRVWAFKQYVENQDGYKLINPDGSRPSNEKDVQLFFGLALIGTSFDTNRESNNGRGPVDFKLSRGAYDKSLIEFKLGSNSQLKRNLQKQVEVYEAANQTAHSVKVIVVYTESDQNRVRAILRELKLEGRENVVVIDARADNKPTGSRA